MEGNASDVGCDDGFPFPEGFGHGQPEAFLGRFLDDDVGNALEDVDKQVVLDGEEDHVVSSRKAFCFLLDFFVDCQSFRIVHGHASTEDQAAVDFLFHPFEYVEDAQRILPFVKSGYLGDDGFVCGYLETFQRLGDDAVVDVHVFGREGVDGRRDDAVVYGEVVFQVCFTGYDDGIVFQEKRLQIIPEIRLGVGQVDVAAPDPGLSLLVELDEGKGLGVVYDDRIVVDVCVERKILVGLGVEFSFDRGKIQGFALEGVVEFFGDGEEIRVAVEYSPARVDPDVVHQGDEGLEHLCDSTSLIRGVDVEDVFSVEDPCFPVYLRDHFVSDDVPVVL